MSKSANTKPTNVTATSEIPDVINYKTVKLHNGRYRMRRIQTNTPAVSSVVITATGTTQIEWKIPANTFFNPARSSLQYQLAIPVQAAGVSWYFEDTAEIVDSIRFGTGSNRGMFLDLNYANNYVNLARKIDTPKADFESLDFTSGLYKKSSVDGATLAMNYFPPGVTFLAGNPYGVAAGVAVTAGTVGEPAYARSSAAAGGVTVTRNLPLSAFTHTFLAMDKDMYFTEETYLQINLAPSYKMGFSATAPASPVTGAAPFDVQPTISLLYLNLACQEDSLITDSIRSQVERHGLSFMIPYQTTFRYSSKAGASSIQLQLTNGYGRTLKRILHMAQPATDSSAAALNHVYDHQNVGSAKISQYQTSINTRPLQDYKVLTADMDDWNLNKEFMRDSAIGNSLAYYYNWFHCDSWSNPKRGSILTPVENILEGLNLKNPVTWTFESTTAIDLNHYSFAEFAREIRVPASGPIEAIVNVGSDDSDTAAY